MKIEKEGLNREEGLKREWIVTNGIGGFASSTVIGANTRKYHGLLVAPLNPPTQRNLLLSKVDESIEIDGKVYNLYTNVCKDYITDGYTHLLSFEKEYVPIYTYQIEDVIIKKYICMEYGKNTVGVLYRIANGSHKIKLTVTPLFNFRDFHKTLYGHQFSLWQKQTENKVRIMIDKNAEYPIFMNMSEGKYIPYEQNQFYNMFYIEEEKRGMEAEENHVIPGSYEIEIEAQNAKDVSFVASLDEDIDEKDVRAMISEEIVRISGLVYDYDDGKSDDEELARDYIIATDNFVIERPECNLHSIIAGYPWFLDWGRDTLISFEGIVLIPKRFKIAKEILLFMIKDVKEGLVPNGYAEYDNKPLYNSADASLLLFEQVRKYVKYTGDIEFIQKEIYGTLKEIIEAYKNGITLDNNNIYLDEDGLISSGTENTQNTWMDVKIGEFTVTPRNGKAVEINSLWYNALKIMVDFAIQREENKQANIYKKMAEKCKKAFIEKFYNSKRKCLFDVLGDSKIRPNQLFALSLTYPVLDASSEKAKEMFETVTKKLLTPYGLKTLAKGEENYVDTYEGDCFRRDMTYHQGPTWPWLLGLYYDAFQKIVQAEKSKTKKLEKEEELEKFRMSVKRTFVKEFTEGKTLGGISEIYDSKKPYEAKAAFQQAWSVAEVFRILL